MEKERKRSLLGKIILLTVTVIWGSSFVILKDTLSSLDGKFTFFILFFRFTVASLIIFVLFYKRIIKIKKRSFIKGAILGVILFSAYSIQTLGLNYTTPSKNAFLTVIYCVLVPFMSWFFLKRKPKPKNYLAAILCFVGVAFVALLGKSESGNNELLGDILTLFCGVFYALQIIYIEKYMQTEESIPILFVELGSVAVLCLILTSFMEFPRYYSEFSLSTEAIWKILYLAIFATCFAQFGQMIGQKYTSPTSTSLILSLETVFGVVFDLLLGNAKLTPFIVTGFIIIFVAELVNELSFTSIKMKITERKNSKNKDKF